VPIPRDNINQVWPLVEPLYAPLYDFPTDCLRAVLEAGEAQLWVIWKSDAKEVEAAFCTRSDGSKTLIDEMAGSGVREWICFLANIEQWARDCGDSEVVVENARLGWKRWLKGYEMERNGDKATYRRAV
jgi:hypothetical protein